jgi:predicted metal-dependent peptidase
MIMPETKSYLSCKKRNRRGAAFDVILPGMVKEGIEVTISIDTSGSIGKKEIEYYMGEITNLFKQFDENTVHATIMMHHSEVYDQFDVATIRDLTQLKTRSGGTSHVDVFNKAEEINTKVLICLTDGYSDFPESTKIAKILWIVTNEGGMSQIPDNLGKKIHVPLEDFADE